jgi:spore coat polysaccharide biosynthesis protein SpsF
MKEIKVKILCVVQARYSSTRLPGKVLMPLGGKPDIEQVFNQVSFSKHISKTILATSSDKSDEKLVEWAINNNVEFYRGSLDDVLDRYFQAAKQYNPEIVVRVTGDCPLIDPEVLDRTIEYFDVNNYDYVSNGNPPTFPDGLDTEVFKYYTLKDAWKNAKLCSEREHVTPYIRNNDNKFKIGNYKNSVDLSKYRWTLDNKEDYEFLSKIFALLSNENSYIKYKDVLKLLDENPELIKINSHIKRNEGYLKSIANDQLSMLKDNSDIKEESGTSNKK